MGREFVGKWGVGLWLQIGSEDLRCVSVEELVVEGRGVTLKEGIVCVVIRGREGKASGYLANPSVAGLPTSRP